MIPNVTPEQMEEIIRCHAPTAHVAVEHINPAYRSWSIMVSIGQDRLEFVWGPLTGFGVSDFSLYNDNPLAPFDFAFASLEAAEAYFVERVGAAA